MNLNYRYALDHESNYYANKLSRDVAVVLESKEYSSAIFVHIVLNRLLQNVVSPDQLKFLATSEQLRDQIDSVYFNVVEEMEQDESFFDPTGYIGGRFCNGN